jgi:hypothetical protein
MLALKYWAVVIMRQTCSVGIVASEVAFAKLAVGFPSVTASSVAGSVVAVLASSEVAAAAEDKMRVGMLDLWELLTWIKTMLPL